jgi:hypothetical protein
LKLIDIRGLTSGIRNIASPPRTQPEHSEFQMSYNANYAKCNAINRIPLTVRRNVISEIFSKKINSLIMRNNYGVKES